MSIRRYSFLDKVVITLDNGIRSLFSQPIASRHNPAVAEPESALSEQERNNSTALMRINHSGEICAQALYYGQALVAKSKVTEEALLKAANEETDHLAWCQERINELKGRTSYLNPLWYTGSLSLGLLAGLLHDKWSLGFVVETERQVEKHLHSHLATIAPQDARSKAILTQMCEDEAHHATVAMGAGAVELPSIIKTTMQFMSKIMTKTTYYL